MSENRCYYLTPDHHLELRVEDVPSPGTGEVLIKIAAKRDMRFGSAFL